MSDDIAERLTAAYDAVAEGYACVNQTMPDDLIEAASEFKTLIDGRGPVLDVGCGAGRDMAWLEREGFIVVGADLSYGMLTQARRYVRGPLTRMDMRRLAFADASFAGVWCCASLLHLPRDEAPGALAEMRRVLAFGGPLYLALQEGDGEGWESVTRYGPAVERYFVRYRMTEVEALLTGAGFRPLRAWIGRASDVHWINVLALAVEPLTTPSERTTDEDTRRAGASRSRKF
ncbi:MAG TPA: class I SAM-dependent methyltransferase [Chloroflexi bacterium]|jgi:SAM-dependent methyltransferase|nr:class I SAM-dependent methyltransferase [Chloroflexota bacterium]